MTHTISLRVYDFLKEFPPFNVLKKEELISISSLVEILYYKPSDYIFKKGQIPNDFFYVIKDGAVGLFENFEEQLLLVNICDEGELFGLRPIIQNDTYKLDAIAREECIVYGIPTKRIALLMNNNSFFRKYIETNFQVNHQNEHLILEQFISPQNSSFFDHQLIQYSKNPVTCSPSQTIQDAAICMEKYQVGSIIIQKNKIPIGIITDKDLRLKVATGKVGIKQPVTQIMSSPVITTVANTTIASAQVKMLQHKITHICITEDGTSLTPIIGILSEHDIVALRNNNPYSLLKEIKRSKTISRLKELSDQRVELLKQYILQEASMAFVTELAGALNDAFTQKCVDLCLLECETPPVSFTWLVLGSQGREEQLLLTDQDHAIVFDDVLKIKYEEIQTYFLNLAEKVTQSLNQIGYKLCPAQMMANNPNWCLPLSQWKKQFNKWITQPDEKSIMMCTIFFDFKGVYGSKELVEQLTNHIFNAINNYEIFINFLAKNTLQNPAPIGFFRQFIVEKNEAHKDEFDLKARVLMPFIDAARLLVLSHKIPKKNSTLKRYDALIEKEPHNKALFQSCKEAFLILLRFRVEQGIKYKNSGRYLVLDSLTKMEKLQLRTCFKPLKEIQELVKIRFRVSQIL